MKIYQLLFCFLLFVYISATAPTSITIDLKSGQSLSTGTSVGVTITVTAAGNGMVLKTLTGLKFKLNDTVSVDLTCSIGASGETCTADTAKEITCTVASLTEAGTYTLDGTVTMTATDSSDQSLTLPTATLESTTATVTSAVAGADPTGITIDLKSSQKLSTGTNIGVKITVTPAGYGMVLKTLTGLKFKLNDTVSVDLTCSIGASGETCTAGTAKEITCTVASLTEVGTYKLDGTASITGTQSDGSTALTSPSATLGSTTATVTEAEDDDDDSNDDDNSSKFLGIQSTLLLLISFLF